MTKKLGKPGKHATEPLPLLFDLRLGPGGAYDLAGRYPDLMAPFTARTNRWSTELGRNPVGTGQAS